MAFVVRLRHSNALSDLQEVSVSTTVPHDPVLRYPALAFFILSVVSVCRLQVNFHAQL